MNKFSAKLSGFLGRYIRSYGRPVLSLLIEQLQNSLMFEQTAVARDAAHNHLSEILITFASSEQSQ